MDWLLSHKGRSGSGIKGELMRNYWLDKNTKPCVMQIHESLANLASWKWGNWFIVKSSLGSCSFLHSDGTWNDATWKEEDGTIIAGFYKTKEEAEAVLATSQS